MFKAMLHPLLPITSLLLALAAGHSSFASSCKSTLGVLPKSPQELEASIEVPISELARLQITIDTLKGETDPISASMVQLLEDAFRVKRDALIHQNNDIELLKNADDRSSDVGLRLVRRRGSP